MLKHISKMYPEFASGLKETLKTRSLVTLTFKSGATITVGTSLPPIEADKHLFLNRKKTAALLDENELTSINLKEVVCWQITEIEEMLEDPFDELNQKN